jgi:hypothetical protein
MKQSKFSEEPVAYALRQADAGTGRVSFEIPGTVPAWQRDSDREGE